MNAYKQITNRIIENLEKASSWSDMITAQNPVNITGRPYRGINLLLLGMSGYNSRIWGTFRQITQYGGRVRKGEKSSVVAFWSRYKTNFSTASQDDVSAGSNAHADNATQAEERWYLKLYHVFNVEQCDFIEGNEYLAQLEGKTNTEAIPATPGKVVAEYFKREGIMFYTVEKHITPFYNPAKDLIGISDYKLYKNSSEFLLTLYHEIIHSTGHPSRLNRFTVGDSILQTKHAYTVEELVAEIGANFLASATGVDADFMNSVAYIKSWISHLKEHPRWIVSAASKAEKAVEYVMNQ